MRLNRMGDCELLAYATNKNALQWECVHSLVAGDYPLFICTNYCVLNISNAAQEWNFNGLASHIWVRDGNRCLKMAGFDSTDACELLNWICSLHLQAPIIYMKFIHVTFSRADLFNTQGEYYETYLSMFLYSWWSNLQSGSAGLGADCVASCGKNYDKNYILITTRPNITKNHK